MSPFLCRLTAWLVGLATIFPTAGHAEEFSFGAWSLSSQAGNADAALHAAIASTDDDNLAFVVAGGIKSSSESCGDALYKQRKELIDSAKNGVIVLFAGRDWSRCMDTEGRPAALERLNRLRELFFADDFSLGASRIPVTHQSASIKFRAYSENMRWEIGGISFATLNLPADNNHYVQAAGRNAEFEDRSVANREWLNRIFSLAIRAKSHALVMFYDGSLATPAKAGETVTRRDGFAEMRNQIEKLAARFPGKVLLVEGASQTMGETASQIVWRKNIGTVFLGNGWTRITVNPGAEKPFSARRLPLEISSGK